MASIVDFTEERLRRQSPEESPVAAAQQEILNILAGFAPAERGAIFAHVFAATDEAARNEAVRTLRGIAEAIMAQAHMIHEG